MVSRSRIHIVVSGGVAPRSASLNTTVWGPVSISRAAINDPPQVTFNEGNGLVLTVLAFTAAKLSLDIK
jgi:hypothetical protein